MLGGVAGWRTVGSPPSLAARTRCEVVAPSAHHAPFLNVAIRQYLVMAAHIVGFSRTGGDGSFEGSCMLAIEEELRPHAEPMGA